MSNLEIKAGRFGVDRASNAATDFARECLTYGLDTTDAIELLREAWDLELHDQKKHAASYFEKVLREV